MGDDETGIGTVGVLMWYVFGARILILIGSFHRLEGTIVGLMSSFPSHSLTGSHVTA